MSIYFTMCSWMVYVHFCDPPTPLKSINKVDITKRKKNIQIQRKTYQN